MSYTKTNWTNGDVITAEKLNNLESGVEAADGGGFFITYDENNNTQLSKTVGETKTAILSGIVPILIHTFYGSTVPKYETMTDASFQSGYSTIMFDSHMYEGTGDDSYWVPYTG